MTLATHVSLLTLAGNTCVCVIKSNTVLYSSTIRAIGKQAHSNLAHSDPVDRLSSFWYVWALLYGAKPMLPCIFMFCGCGPHFLTMRTHDSYTPHIQLRHVVCYVPHGLLPKLSSQISVYLGLTRMHRILSLTRLF